MPLPPVNGEELHPAWQHKINDGWTGVFKSLFVLNDMLLLSTLISPPNEVQLYPHVKFAGFLK